MKNTKSAAEALVFIVVGRRQCNSHYFSLPCHLYRKPQIIDVFCIATKMLVLYDRPIVITALIYLVKWFDYIRKLTLCHAPHSLVRMCVGIVSFFFILLHLFGGKGSIYVCSINSSKPMNSS